MTAESLESNIGSIAFDSIVVVVVGPCVELSKLETLDVLCVRCAFRLKCACKPFTAFDVCVFEYDSLVLETSCKSGRFMALVGVCTPISVIVGRRTAEPLDDGGIGSVDEPLPDVV